MMQSAALAKRPEIRRAHDTTLHNVQLRTIDVLRCTVKRRIRRCLEEDREHGPRSSRSISITRVSQHRPSPRWSRFEAAIAMPSPGPATAATDLHRPRRSALQRGRFVRWLHSLCHQHPEQIASPMITRHTASAAVMSSIMQQRARLDAQAPAQFVYHDECACCVSSCGEMRGRDEHLAPRRIVYRHCCHSKPSDSRLCERHRKCRIYFSLICEIASVLHHMRKEMTC